MSIDDLYNNFKIVEQSVKKSIGVSTDAQNLAFMIAPSTSITNDANTVKPAYEVSTVSPNVNTTSHQVSTASFSDNAVYAFMIDNPNGSNLLQQDLEQIHKDDLEAMDLKWQLSPLNMREKRWDTLPGNVEHQGTKRVLNRVMAEEQVQTNMALMAFSNFKNEVLFSKEVVVLKREVACKYYEINVLKSEFEKVKKEKVGNEFKIKKFDKASKDIDKLLGSQIIDKSKKGLGYNVVPPPYPLIYNRPKKFDLSYSGLDEFKDPKFKSYGFEDSKQESNIVCDKKSDASKENFDDFLVKEQVSEYISSFVESPLNVDKETVFLDKKIEIVKPINHENLVKNSVRYAEMYRSQSPRGNQRNWNGQKSNQLGSNFVMYNKACFICGSFDHVQAHCKYHQRERMLYGNNYNRVNYNYTTKRTYPNAQRNMFPRAVLMKTSLKPFNTAITVNTTHHKSIVFSAKSMLRFSKLAQSTAKAVNNTRPKAVNTARPHSVVVNAVRRIDDTQISDQPKEQLGVFSATTALADAARRRQSVENVQTYTRRSRLVSTANIRTTSEVGSTAGVIAKDKGKAIMQETEPPKKIKKRVQVQMSIDEELAKKQLDERDEVVAQALDIDWSDPADINWSDPANQGGYKLSHFKGMSYEDIRPIFEIVWDQNQAFVPKDSKIEKEVMKRSGFDLKQEFVKKDEASSFTQKQPARGSKKKSLARKRARETLSEESAKKQKLEDDTEKEELQVYLNIVPEEESLNIESLATKYPIVDWETQILANDKYYYQIKRADGSVKHYKIFSAMLYDFDRQDVLELYRLVKERFQTASPEGYDLLLWGDLKTMIEPNEEDEIWRNQQD
ncbi:hypothetical protein Tco_1554016 [Tanacetum coccineum]